MSLNLSGHGIEISDESWALASPEAKQCFESTVIMEMLDRKDILPDALLQITHRSTRLALESPAIRTLLDKKLITINQILTINNGNTRLMLELPITQQWIREERLNINQLLIISSGQVRVALASQRIQQLVNAGILEPAQILTFTDSTPRSALENRENYHRLLRHEITLEEVLNPPADIAEEKEEKGDLQLNAKQNTHTASIHRTASESAARLWSRYGKKISTPAVIQNEIRAFLRARENSKSSTAERCLRHLLDAGAAYVDPSSGISLHQLLYLTWLAVQDNSLREAPLADALDRFVQGLYEAQRDGNLNSAAIDRQYADSPACFSGTFNKLVEILDGIHPDAHLEYITKETFSLKFPCIVQEEAQAYLELMSFRMSHEKWETMISDANRDLPVIWDAISGRVSERLFDEFGCLFAFSKSEEFKNELCCGQSASFQFSQRLMEDHDTTLGEVAADLLNKMGERWGSLSRQLNLSGNAASEKIRKDLNITGDLAHILLDSGDSAREKLIQFSTLWQQYRASFEPPPETYLSTFLRFFKPVVKSDDLRMAEKIDSLLAQHVPAGLRKQP